jgi:predicted metalloprotease
MVVRRAGGGGIGAIIVILILAYFLGINPLELLSGNVPTSVSTTSQRPPSPQEDEMRDFVATVLADTEDVWSAIFTAGGAEYPKPTLELFTEQTRSKCGFASAATGPFYCPADQDIYIDLQFYNDLRSRFGAPGDFAQAYVLAHEVGHHVQNVVGTLPLVHQQRAEAGEAEGNELSVRTELQADCYAGIWAHHTEQRGLLEAGDIDEALTAAAAVGDDALQRQSQGYVVPDSFTHGSSEQRATWFRKGYETGSLDACNTFEGAL